MPSLFTKTLALLIGSSTSLFAYWTLTMYLKRRKYRHIPGPPIKGLFGLYFGNMQEVIENGKKGGLYYELLLQWYLVIN